MSTDNSRYTLLHTRTQSFLAAFIAGETDKILTDQLTTTPPPRVTEYGPSWATSRLPFLGKTFVGREGWTEYFTAVDSTLEILPSSTGSEAEVSVDEREGVACVRGKAVFKAVKTGREWEEDFVMRVSGFDGEGRIGVVEVWGDTLSE
ncbi:hypothetical protein PRZ48_014740 [Zasmidium cellare]|uniref:SnoaL-like domain-containing protein n=1 Tax=Zasmidium cellare TaxID=395010 RepID=A0ABR0DZ47_ZASCE|nr:hypothetical protein PRZ48_014740 [Zasmidium cellare]